MRGEKVLCVGVGKVSNNNRAAGNEHIVLRVGMEVNTTHYLAGESDGVVELDLVNCSSCNNGLSINSGTALGGTALLRSGSLRLGRELLGFH